MPIVAPVAAQAAPAWRVIDLGAGEDSSAVAVNDRGHVAIGRGGTSFLWRSGRLTDIGSLGGGYTQAAGLNNRDELVGWSFLADGDSHAFVWRNGTMTDLGVLPGGVHSAALGINDRGDVVGYSDTADGQHAVLWRNGRAIDLGGDAIGHLGHAYDINNAGVIAGTWGDGNYDSLAVRWSATGRRTLLSTERSVAYSVNTQGHILGAFRTVDSYDDGFLWRNGAFTKVTPPPGLRMINLTAVNDRDQAVGAAYVGGDSGFEATIWQNGTASTLPKLGKHAQAQDINERGQVAGYTTTDADGWTTRAVLWAR
ncbi:MAG: hypothetical protein ABW046_05290 [Actinoplanes sp.]